MSTPSNTPTRLGIESLEDRTVASVTWHGGPVLGHVQAENLYLGSAWSSSDNYSAAPYLVGLTGTLVNSRFTDVLGTYGVGRGSVLPGSILNYSLGSSITDGQIQYAIQQSILNGHAYQPGGNSLYVVFVQPGVSVVDSQGQSSARGDFAGYHSFFVGRDNRGASHYIPYAVIPCPGGGANPPPQLYGYKNELAEMTDAASHEVAEAATDPLLNAWYDDARGEAGDITNRYHQYLNGYYVQLISNRADQAMLVSNSQVFYLGTDGAWASNDGVHWGRTNVGYEHTAIPVF